MESEGDGDGAGDRQRQERKERRSYHDKLETPYLPAKFQYRMGHYHLVRAHLRPGTYHVLVLMELQRICGTGAQGDGSLLNALSRKCYMHMLQYVHRGTLP